MLLGAVISIQPWPLEADSSWVHVFGIIVLEALQSTEAEAGYGAGSMPPGSPGVMVSYSKAQNICSPLNV